MEIPNWLAESGPRVPLESLIEEVNKIYHSFDAINYDSDHPEIHRQLPPIWTEMIARMPHSTSWNILDLGCGTGFEANLLLNKLGDKVIALTAFDPSVEMMAICKKRLSRFSQVRYCSRIEEAHSHGPFNLLLTNSLLHHLPNVAETIESLLPILSGDAVWLAGHEPSARFYRNSECLKLSNEYGLYRRNARWFGIGNYARKLRRLLRPNTLSATAHDAYRRGLFLKKPHPSEIAKIVDFHVASSADEADAGRGLDIEKMQAWLQRDWTLQWSRTYSFLGPFCATTPGRWRKRAHRLELQYPADGANFCMVWRRRSSSSVGRSV